MEPLDAAAAESQAEPVSEIALIETISVDETLALDDYEGHVHLSEAVRSFRTEARSLAGQLEGRTVWMVSSTARGGGVAEMLPRMIAIFRELGVDVRWVVIGSDNPDFFRLTKRLHNLIHDSGDPALTAADRALYEAVSRENAEALRPHLRPGDLLVAHDPQPLGSGAILRRGLDVRAVFRCHIGLDRSTPRTQAAWEFLKRHAAAYDHAVFTAPEYSPDFLAGRAGIIRPAIDPLSHKNRELHVRRLVGILCNAGLVVEQHPVVPDRSAPVPTRLAPDGSFAPATDAEDVGLLFRPVVTQVSRWDRLKWFKPLLKGFLRLKERAASIPAGTRHRRRLETVRLVMAGAEPGGVADDPEAQEVLQELAAAYTDLPPASQADIALISLPMAVRKENELIVNALQRCSSVVMQNSLQEGFGLTVTEAMWKRAAVLGSRACGIRQQIRDGVDGRLIQDPEDPEEIAARLDALLEDVGARIQFGQNAQRRVKDEFLVFTQVRDWLATLTEQVRRWRDQPAWSAG